MSPPQTKTVTASPCGDDCDDADENVNPDAEELPGNGLDDDCDPNTSDDVLDADQDGDGVPDAEDCAPSDPAIAEDCAPTHTVYAGGSAGCGVAPRPLGLMGVVLAFAFTRRRGSAISRV
ncbi:MAG: putative metal-binding motif-containing protein [Deltaproteobacteria bacterium]|nr:putative metal-binding motif-containing protein [Deltaproteobacteria bacterium]